MVNPSIHLQLQHTGDEHGCPPGQYRPARCGNPNLGFVEPAPSATRARCGPIPGSEILPYIYDSNKPGTTTVVLPVETAPHGVVWKPQPHWLIADWLGFVKPPGPGEYTIPFSEQNAFLISTTPINRGRKRLSPGRCRPVRCENPNCGYTVVSWGS